jgi:spoIIIJ-associated protein
VTNDPSPNPESSPAAIRGNAERVGSFCRELVSRMDLQLQVEVAGDERDLTVNLTGADRPLLLSNAASLLNSIEYLINKAFRTGKDEEIRAILLDSDSYRQHREAELTLLARMASEKVIAKRKPLVLQPMTPRERRIVHLALAAVEGVRSESNGVGEQRSVTIYPTD